MRQVPRIILVLTALAVPGMALASGEIFHFIGPDDSITYDPATGVGSGVLSFFIQEDTQSPGFPNNVAGWSMGNECDPNLVTVILVEQGEYLETEIEPAFFAPAVLPNGFTVGCVYDFFGQQVCTYEEAKEVLLVTYDTVEATLAGDLDGETTNLVWVDTLGTPQVETTLVLSTGASVPPLFNDGIVELVPEVAWRRSDCNGDGAFNIADGIFLLNFLFQDGPPSTCNSACDVNGDSFMDSSDAIYSFNYQLLGGPPPPAPFPDCGTGVDDDCDSYAGCAP